MSNEKKTEERMGADEILAAVKMIRPGEEVPVVVDKETVGKVLVKDVTLGQLEDFSQTVGRIIPLMSDALSSVILSKVQSGELPRDEEELGNMDFAKVIGGKEMLGRLLPIVFQHMVDLVDDSCEPKGVVKNLSHDVAVPIVSKWVEMNILDPGKIEAWTTAFSGLMDQAKEMGLLERVTQSLE